MGLQFTLPKENNAFYTDVIDAYWSIDDIAMGKDGDAIMVRFEFTAYPSREAKLMQNTMVGQLMFGGPIFPHVNAALYQWIGLFQASEIFPDGMPIEESAQKDTLYPFIKDFLGLLDAIDVLEDEA
jgi:hypothetical protein